MARMVAKEYCASIQGGYRLSVESDDYTWLTRSEVRETLSPGVRQFWVADPKWVHNRYSVGEQFNIISQDAKVIVVRLLRGICTTFLWSGELRLMWRQGNDLYWR